MIFAKVFIVVVIAVNIISLGWCIAKLDQPKQPNTPTAKDIISKIVAIWLLVALAYSIGWWF